MGLQSYWADAKGNVSWIEPDGNIDKKRPDNRKIGYKIHGHTIFRGSVWQDNFEGEFDIDNEVHRIIFELQSLKPLGRNPSEFLGMMKILIKKDRTLRDMCKFYHLEEHLHRKLLLMLHSLLIRSPGSRSRYEGYPRLFGLKPDEEVGKMNMKQSYTIAKKLCERGQISNHYFVLLHSPLKKFIFGDGILDWLTSGLTNYRINGRALVPLTPNLCVYFCTPSSVRPSPNCASLSVAPWIVDWVNNLTQIYSRDKLFFLGRPPKLSNSFLQRQFLEHTEKTDTLIDMLDEIAGIKKRHGIFVSGSFL